MRGSIVLQMARRATLLEAAVVLAALLFAWACLAAVRRVPGNWEALVAGGWFLLALASVRCSHRRHRPPVA
jgi:hypothetical protein